MHRYAQQVCDFMLQEYAHKFKLSLCLMSPQDTDFESLMISSNSNSYDVVLEIGILLQKHSKSIVLHHKPCGRPIGRYNHRRHTGLHVEISYYLHCNSVITMTYIIE